MKCGGAWSRYQGMSLRDDHEASGHSQPERAGGDASVLSSDAGVAVYLAFLECIARDGDLVAAARFLAPGFVEHGVGRRSDGDELLEQLVARRQRFPHDEWTIDTLVSVGELIVCHAETSYLAPTGRSVRVR